MTRFIQLDQECAVCGHSARRTVLASTNTFGGSPNLDLRPPGMARRAMLRAVMTCNACGYCSTDITKAPAGAQRTVQSDAYKAQGEASQLPRLARSWLCHSLVLEEAREFSRAGWSALTAAWLCDDEGGTSGARMCRQRALRLLLEAQDGGESVAESPEAGMLVIADVHRRLSEFDQCRSVAQASAPSDARLQAATAFTAELGRRELSGPYTFDEAERYARAPETWRPKRWYEFWR